MAADMRRPVYKAPPPPPPPVYNWTGFYVGGNIGYSWGKADTDVELSGFQIAPLAALPIIPGTAFSHSAARVHLAARRRGGVVAGDGAGAARWFSEGRRAVAVVAHLWLVKRSGLF